MEKGAAQRKANESEREMWTQLHATTQNCSHLSHTYSSEFLLFDMRVFYNSEREDVTGGCRILERMDMLTHTHTKGTAIEEETERRKNEEKN